MTYKLSVTLVGAWLGAQCALTLTHPSSSLAQSVHPNVGQNPHPQASSVEADRFVAELMEKMSLEEKIGQMIQADIDSITPQDLRQYKLGSILAGGNAAPGNRLRTSPQAWLDLTDEFYRASLATGGAHQAIPILFGIDAVHGHAKVLGATIFPHNVGLGAAHDPALIERIGAATAQEVAATGIDWTFAPTVAVVRDVRWGRSYESYSESPDLVASYAPAMVRGLQGRRGTPQFMAEGHTLSSVKHFLGDGGTAAGRDQGDTLMAEPELLRVHAAGYRPAIDAGAMIVMASYNSWNGEKLHGNHHLLTDVLKGQLGFDGFVVGDWNAHEQLPGCTKASCAAAFLAGVDMLMAPDEWKALYVNTLAQARSGEIPQSRIDDAVRRILRVKAISGLFTRPPPRQRADAGHFAELGSPAHRAVAREAVRKSLVLLKNTHALLPLNPHARVLVAGDAADDIGMQTGGWTIDWQGDRNSNADFKGATSIYAGVAAVVARAGGSAELNREANFSRRPDVAIVVFGEHPYAEFQGDRENLEFSPHDKSALSTLRRLRTAGIPTVSVFVSGRPLWVNPEINASDAFVAAWLPGSEGAGIADVLFRTADGTVAYDFTGRLAFSWPNTAMPVTFDVGDRVSGALFAAGFGLADGQDQEPRVLGEDPAIAPPFNAPEGSLFTSGHPTAPWSLFVADGDAEVHVTTAHQASPHGVVSATLKDDGVNVTWQGAHDGSLRISGRAVDLRGTGPTGTVLTVRYKLDSAPVGTVALGVRVTDPANGTLHDALLDLKPTFRAAPVGVWQSLMVPVYCLKALAADLARVEVPFVIRASGAFGVTLGDVRLAAAGAERGTCPGPAGSIK